MYKPLADSTLQRMKKTEIIELLRIAEHNAKVAQEYVDQQAKNLKDWAPVVHGRWGTRSDRPDSLICSICNCGFDMWKHDPHNYCPNCGARMDGGKHKNGEIH